MYLRIWSFLICAVKKIWRHFELLQKLYRVISKLAEPISSARSPGKAWGPCCSAIHFTLSAAVTLLLWGGEPRQGAALVCWGWLPLCFCYTQLPSFDQSKANDTLRVWLLDLCMFIRARITVHGWGNKYFSHYETIFYVYQSTNLFLVSLPRNGNFMGFNRIHQSSIASSASGGIWASHCCSSLQFSFLLFMFFHLGLILSL